MEKTAAPANISAPGDITYTFTFTNTGNVALTNLGIVDGNIDQTTLVCDNDTNSDGTIDVLAVGTVTQTCTATRPVTQAQINAGTALVNTATATASGPNGTGTVAEADTTDNTTSTPVIQNPSYNMVKTAESDLIIEAGEITYTFTFTNTCNVDLANLRVIDANIDVGTISCGNDLDVDQDIDQLDTGTIETCTALRTITAAQLSTGDPIVNEATSEVETLDGAFVVPESSLLDNRVSTPVMKLQPEDIPTLSGWMLMLLSLLLLMIGLDSQKQNIKRHPPTF